MEVKFNDLVVHVNNPSTQQKIKALIFEPEAHEHKSTRRHFTSDEKRRIEAQLKAGVPVKDIAHSLNREPASIYNLKYHKSINPNRVHVNIQEPEKEFAV